MNLFELGVYAYEHTDQIEAAAADFAKAGAAIGAGVSLACSIVAPWLEPAKTPGGVYDQFRKVVNVAGHNYKAAKNAN